MQNIESDISSSIKSAATSFLKNEESNKLSELITSIEKIYVSRALEIHPESDELEASEKLIKIAIPLESQLYYLEEQDPDDLLRGYSLIALIFEYAAKISKNEKNTWLFWLRSSLSYLKARQSANSIICAKKALEELEKQKIECDEITELALKFLIRDLDTIIKSSKEKLEKLKKELENENSSFEKQSRIFGEIEFCISLNQISNFMINGEGDVNEISHHLELSLSHYKKSNNEKDTWLISRLSIAILELMKNSLWNLKHVLHPEIIKAFTQHENPIYELWDNQLMALQKIIQKESKKHHTLVMPTSAGKTLVAALTIAKELYGNGNVCFYVTPYRALVSEVSEFLTKYLGRLGIKTSYLPGKFDSIPYLENLLGSDGRVFVLTPEKLDLLWRTDDKRLKECGIFIFDEVQNIGEEGRGLRLELLISRIKQYFGIYSRIILLSAVIPENSLGNFIEWIGSKTSDASKIDLKPTRSLGAYYYRAQEQDCSGNIFYWGRFNIRNILQPEPNVTTRGDASELAIKYSKYLGPVLVYCNSKDDTESTAELIFQKMTLLKEGVDMEEEAKFAETILGQNSTLPKMLRYGIAYHHAAVPDAIKNMIEKLGRDGKLNIICSTSTLIEGVNLNVSTVIISSPYSGQVLMNGLKIKNLAGRAGRALKDTEGHVITMHAAVKAALAEDLFMNFQSRFFRYLSSLYSPTLDADVDALESDLLSRFYRKEISMDKIEEDAEKVMKTTLFSRQSNSLQYSAIMNGVKQSANKIMQIPDLQGVSLKVFAETGLGIRNCQLLEKEAKKISEYELGTFRKKSKPDIEKIMNIIQASLLPSSRFGTRLQNSIKNPLDIIESWFNGKSILEIASFIEKNPSAKTVRSVTQFLYGYVSDEISWTIASLLKLIDSKNTITPEMSLDYEWYLLPSYLKYGVNNPVALVLMLSGINNRDYVNRITKEMKFSNIDWIKIINMILTLEDKNITKAQNNILTSLGSFAVPIRDKGVKSGICTVESNGVITQDKNIVGIVEQEFNPILKILSFKKCFTFITSDMMKNAVLQINPA